ncbi:MAG: hypothetical protein KAJ14_05765 [Candidatus Omnitrophica bacterium]|nr:hypothetical protein [Candidatus Omnitrophota bacterium]MCK5393557.1 hypothetical protein [Candidatus Omnitrophota bacterium]MCK5492599.1 hypothetical protein [Candidatus Omnitrophota bacterium]
MTIDLKLEMKLKKELMDIKNKIKLNSLESEKALLCINKKRITKVLDNSGLKNTNSKSS